MKKGRVYKIQLGESLYVGSTSSTLKQRSIQHLSRFNTHNYKQSKLYKELENHEEFELIELEAIFFNDLHELTTCEQKWVDILCPNLNERAADVGLSHLVTNSYDYKKAYAEIHKEDIANYHKEYRKTYKEIRKERERKLGLRCDICDTNFALKSSFNRHNRTFHSTNLNPSSESEFIFTETVPLDAK